MSIEDRITKYVARRRREYARQLGFKAADYAERQGFLNLSRALFKAVHDFGLSD